MFVSVNFYCFGFFICTVVVSLTASSAISDNFKQNDVLRDEDNLIMDMSTAAVSSLSTSSEPGMSLDDQVRLLSKQMSALMNRRREDYKMLETSLKNSVRKNAQQFGDLDLRNEVNQLR